MKEERGLKQLQSVETVRAHQREWLKTTRERVKQGEPFAICNGDEFEEIFNILDIPVIVINYYNSIIMVKGMGDYYRKILAARGWEELAGSFPGFAYGLATTIDNKPEIAPWGGLPRPTVIIGGSKEDIEMRVLEIWAREYGCPFFPMEFSLDGAPDQPIMPPRWFEKMPEHWDELYDPRRLDFRVEQEKALISFLEVTTGRTFSLAKLNRCMDLINEQMLYWSRTQELIANTCPCPVSLRDQIAMVQTTWHRGTEKGRDFTKAYYEEVKERVKNGEAAYPGEKFRLVGLTGTTPPLFSQYLQEKYGAVFVCQGGSLAPATSYTRKVINNDPLRTAAARHMVLFVENPDWHLESARLHHCDGAVQIVDPLIPSSTVPFFEKAGMPIVTVPRDGDDQEIRDILDKFMDRLLKMKK
jgi:benzoyl-CoA reductase subunit B